MSSTASPLGAEILVNTRTTGTEVLPAVAVLTGGSFVVTWSDLGSTSGDIRARLFNAAGQPLGDEFAVNSNSVIEQNHPRVAALANGGFVIVWQDSGEPLLDTDETSIKLQRFDAAGNKLGGEKLVNQFITGDQLFPTVTALAGGGFVVTFEDYSGLYNDGLLPAIVAQAFDDNGVSLTNQFRVNQEPYQAQNLPEVAGLAGGDFVAVWEDWSGRIGDTAVSGIALQRVSASGGYVGGEVLVNTTTASFQRDPSVAALAGGGFVVAWEDESGGGAEGAVIRAQRFDASGVKQGTEFLVNTTTAGTQTDPVAVGLAGGGFVIGWHDTSNAPGDGSVGAVRAQLFDAGGVRVGSEMLLNHTTQGLQWQLALAAQGDGGFIAAWTDNSRAFADPVGSAIVAQRFALGDPSPGDDTLDLSGPGGGTVAGGSGDDIYIVDDPADNPVELPGSGVDTVQSSISWVLSAEFEALVLTGTADIDGTGNALANTISGNSGRNLLDGGAGADTLIGGAGGDTYLIDDPGDTVIETANAGALPLAGAGGRPTDAGADADTIVSSLGRAVLSAYVESGVLAEGSAAREMLGNALANIIDGNSAANLLQGGPGDDTLNGGEGIDVAAYAGDRARYTVTVNAQTVTVKDNGGDTGSEGLDTLNSIEVLLFADQVMPLGGLVLDTGTTGTDILALTDLAAQAGAGGAGNDTYETGTTADAVLELDGEGVDTVRSQADWTLWDNLEHLVLTGAALTGAGNAAANAITGNALGNRLWGYAGNDTLDGGAGTDTLRGGAGNDLYEVGAGDVIEEQPGDGIDTVRSAISWALAAETEKLVLTGSTAANGIGNALANTLTGNVATNRLDGGGGNDTLNGGAGIDTLVGGAGNDTYVVTSNDKLVESKNNGADTVQSAVTWTLAVNLEKLTLTGSAAVNGTGNTGANTLAGNAAANLLKGAAGNDTLTGAGGNDTLAGGSGSDRLSGGTGADTFAFDTAPAAGNRDTITDFTTGSDRIRLDDDVFSAFAASQSTTLAAGALRVGAGTNAAQDADDRILYDTASGALYYDADGTGPVAAVQFAVLGVGTHPSLGATDFLIFD